MAKNKKKFYGVKVGRVVGVYEAWDEAEAQVKGFEGALHKSFATRAAAEKYVASPPAPGFVTRRRSSDGGQPVSMFAYPAEVTDAAEPAGGAADDADLPVPAPTMPVPTSAVNDREDDAPATAPRWFDPSASTRPTSTEARATWGEFGGRLVMSGPDADNLRPMIDFYERPTGFDEGVTNVLREAPARRANTSRRASGAAHDLHYDHEDGSGWEIAPGKRTRDAFGLGVPAGTILRAQPEPARDAGFPMGGVTVHFPRGLTPHVPQKITMSKVIAALRQRQNALIESPTGTGKSLSLLCSALAWQEAEATRVAAENEKIGARNAAIRAAKHRARQQLRRDGVAAVRETREATVTTVTTATTTHEVTADGVVVPRATSVEAAGTTTSKYFDAKEGNGDGDGDGGANGEAVAPGVSVHVVKDEKPDLLEEFRFRVPNPGGGRGGVKVEAGAGAADADVPIPSPDEEEQGMLSVPRIYLCSRTHSQLHQLVKELKRTPYRPRYTILGSRAQYCPIKKSDDECADLTKNKASRPLETGCGYYNKKGKLLTELRHAGIWDMEDMAEAADAHRSCKFFAMKDLLADAELVLCPYNYIFDPGIRNALGIELGNAAVIIDEGHNVEDVCREGASFEASLKDLQDGVNELESVVNFYGEAQSALQFMSLMHGWLNRQLDQAKNDGARDGGRAHGRGVGGFASKMSGPVVPGPDERLWKGEEGERALLHALCPTLAGTGANVESVRRHALMVVDKAIAVADYSSPLRQKISDTGKSFGESSLGKCYGTAKAVRSLLTNPRDYVLYAVPDLDHPGETDSYFAGRRFGGSDSNTRGQGAGVAMWCLRPSVAFGPVSDEAMCVIVTSGTLSPIGSLEGELGVKFPVKVEAPHVVPRRQIHVEALDALGDFTARTQDNPKMPAQLARLLLKYLRAVPRGTGSLVFLPKYALIRRIMEDWERSGALAELEALVGTVLAEEPGAQTFASTLDVFRGAIDAKDGGGALMLAVYRGKVSEGLDFKDDFARAVFCVGIPFPSVGDVKVRLKREYNNSRYARDSGLMPGGDWYSHQAFRAYNQALGRCIRHQHDYASIFLVDARFCMSEEADRNKAMVSKWMRNLVQRFRDSRESVGTLGEFFQRIAADPPGPPKETTHTTAQLATHTTAQLATPMMSQPPATQDEVLGVVDVTFTQAERLRRDEAVRDGRHVDLTLSDDEDDGDGDEGEGEGEGEGRADVLAASAVALPE